MMTMDGGDNAEDEDDDDDDDDDDGDIDDDHKAACPQCHIGLRNCDRVIRNRSFSNYLGYWSKYVGL